MTNLCLNIFVIKHEGKDRVTKNI